MIKVPSFSLRFVGGRSDKFWTIQPIGHRTALTTWGRTGVTLQSKIFKFEERVDMLDFVERRAEQKFRKGYKVSRPAFARGLRRVAIA